jgi:hypothetical protein
MRPALKKIFFKVFHRKFRIGGYMAPEFHNQVESAFSPTRLGAPTGGLMKGSIKEIAAYFFLLLEG